MTYKKEEIKEYFEDRLEDYKYSQIIQLVKDNELHNEIFNTDYYIIGTYKAKEWLGSKAFDIIGFIKDYEVDNFGEVFTDFSNAEKVVNMYVYILGEEIINNYESEVNN